MVSWLRTLIQPMQLNFVELLTLIQCSSHECLQPLPEAEKAALLEGMSSEGLRCADTPNSQQHSTLCSSLLYAMLLPHSSTPGYT